MLLFNKETLQLITHVIQKNGWIELPAQGTSMYPFIKKGDICRFIACETSSIRKGDIILFRTSLGSLVAHRFYQSKSINHQIQYHFKGDTNLGHDEAIAHDQIIGKLNWIRRNKTIIHVTDLSAHVWSKIILSFPILSLILRIYLNRKESTQA
jgi:signal peptidase